MERYSLQDAQDHLKKLLNPDQVFRGINDCELNR